MRVQPIDKGEIDCYVYIARVTPNRKIQDGVATGQEHKKLYYELQVFGLFDGLTASKFFGKLTTIVEVLNVK